ncbi:uncharacterized protein LOC117547738 isoform X2 [Gymnodraco acuticeps]|uniref:Uncharacterized protein LOC117547738 isoform X2 n=1 Tax=Gymnodraco acuticeps TaxID=8218 RepID=A0A6P8UC26_GYMAC|nr:uncharacterized protein LOC117547738 isoform X2 [Gymnodraco acuticeps]
MLILKGGVYNVTQVNTTISYEAVPAVGADGTNIMKLIPVQTVNRQFFQSPTSQPETDPTPQRAEAMNISSEPVQMFKTNVEPTNSVNKYLSQQQNTRLRTIAPSATPAANIGMSGRVPSHLPVTVKSLELPRGQCPQTPSNTQVQTVPAPELPKKQILTLSANSSPSTGLFNGLTLSCFNQEFDQKMDSAFNTLQFICKVAGKHSLRPRLKDSPHLTLIPKGSQKPNSPMKWVVGEEDGSIVPTPDPINSVTSEVLRIVAERENAKKLCDGITKPSHTLEPVPSLVASEIIRVAAERENAEKLCQVMTKPGPTLEPVPYFVSSEILRVAAEKEKASKQCDVISKPLSGSSPGTSVHRQNHNLVIKNREDAPQQKKVDIFNIPRMAVPTRNSGEVGRNPSQIPVTVTFPALGTTARNGEKLGKTPSQHPITVKSTALPRGHGLRSPPDTEVGPVLVSVVPPAIKKHVPTSSANSRPSSGLPNVVNLSPTTSVNQGVNSQSDSTLEIRKFICNNSPKKSSGPPSKVSKPHLRLIQRVSKRPNSPMKWVVDDDDDDDDGGGPTAPTLDPIDSSVASEIFRVVAERENLGKHCDVIPKPESGSSQGKNVQGPETVIVCDGKVFLVPKHCSLQFETGKSNWPLAESKAYEFNKTIGPSCQQSVKASALQKRGGLQIIPQDESCEVIDLCDDGAHKDSSQPSVHLPGVTHPFTSDSSSGICCQIEKDTDKIECSVSPATSWTSTLAAESCKMADPLLRHMFGITADVKISLPRIDKDSSAKLLLSESIKSVEDNQEQASGLQQEDVSLQDLYSLQDSNSCNGTVNVPTGKVLKTEPEDSDSPTPLYAFYYSGSTLDKGTSCHIKSEPECGYVEPIDEDFLSTDESNIPNSRDIAGRPQTPTCVDPNTNTGRMGRKRKRTMCPCCVPAGGHGARSQEEPKKWAWETAQTSRKGGRTKFAKKVGKTSGKINCQKVKECKAAEGLVSDSETTVTEVVKLHEQIQRLKELLHEKEDALKLMTSSVGGDPTI